MVDFTFDIEIHVGGCFVEDPTFKYVGGSVHTLTEIDPDKLSFFEIRDLCHLVGAPKEHSRYRYLLPQGNVEDDIRDIETDVDVVNMTTLHRAWPADKIIIYTDIDVEPLAVEHPDGGGVADDGVGGDAGGDVGGIGGDADDEDAEVGARVEEQNLDDDDDDDDDWLYEGLESDDFGDDIFAAPNSAPQDSAPKSSDAPNTALNSSDAPNTAPESSNAPHADPEWAEPALEDDLVSMDGSDDEQKEMKFPNAKVFRAALREYAIKKLIDIKFKLNERTKISVHCKNECGWRCYASQISGELTFQIKTLTADCTCPKSFKNSQATSAYVANKFIEDFGKNPNWEVTGVHNHVMQNLSVDLSLNQVYRSKRKAKDLINGDEQLQYGVLRDYAQMINTVDKGSRVILQTEMADETSQPKFKRMYVRFNAQKVGFLGGCRPFIGLDGCHIKHRFGGQILSATALDANDNIFPVAMAVVEQENKESWTWFLEIFADDIGRLEELQLVFISDRQKGLIPAIETLFPTVEHRYYVKHIYNNFKVDHKGLELKDALWRCAAATKVREFERCMQYIKDLDEKAHEYLANIAPEKWSRSHFTPRALTDYLVNNLSESFNSVILKSRDKPILAMLEWIRVRLMTRLYTKREGIQRYAGKLCPSIQAKLEKLKVESKPFSATPAGSFLYEVASQYERHVVDLVKKTCSCRYWDLNGIPCKHAITAIYTNLETPETYTHPCYHKEAYMEIYKELLPPMPGQLEWAETGQPAPVAPHIYKPPGRPPKQRKKAADEPRNPYKASRMNRPVRCGKCKKEGHNSRGCKASITGETPWQRRQRLEREKAARGGVPAPRTRSGSAPQDAPQPPSQQPAQPYNMRSATQPSSSQQGNQASQQGNQASQQGNQARPSHTRAGWFSSSQPKLHTPRETWDTLPSSSQPSPAYRSTGGVRSRGQLAAQRPPKMTLVGGKSKGKK
ncbi:hypothetical protein SO802_002475 [Lithocarpus litseifolius]|uniref:SWIM-type domain-containing protein n=1 Tax=Lithocarpus litseifolius TaxID=425828 RepID=A0AAW2E2P4_9ROSI